MSDAKLKSTDLAQRMATFKKRLLARKRELEEQLQEISEAKEAPDAVQDPGDHAQSLSQETLRISLQDAEMNEYSMILQALHMIEEGTYGLCIECGQPIAEKRLLSYPNATRCLICQEVFEDQKTTG